MTSTSFPAVSETSPSDSDPAAAATSPRRSSSRADSGQRPEIQALRAIAVALVVIYHAWPDVLPGGFVGVDVFFAISGFLIIGHLLREVEVRGTVSLPGFWARRARRILPAALFVLFVSLIGTIVLVPRVEWRTFLPEIRASTFYFENWHLADAAVDYLASDDAASPVRHYWSLSVEEQFYIVWPVMIVIVALAMRRASAIARRNALALVLVTVTVTSLVLSITRTDADPAAAYFVTYTRAWEFAAGGLLAFLPTLLLARRLRAVLSWLGIAAVVVAGLAYSDATPFPGSAALLPVLGALAIIAAGAPPLRWSPTPLLRLWPFQKLGDISYSFYLWHWPLLILAPYALDREKLTDWTIAVILVLTTVAAAVTKIVLEDPVRRGRFLVTRRAGWTFATMAVASGLVFGVSASATNHFNNDLDKAKQLTARVLAEPPACFGAAARDTAHPCENAKLRTSVVPSPSEAEQASNSPCTVTEKLGRVRACAFGDLRGDKAKTIVLLGDSHATHWRSALQVVAEREKLPGISLAHAGCPFSTSEPKIPEPGLTTCLEWNQDVLKWFARHPEVATVVVSQHTFGEVVRENGRSNFEQQVVGYRGAWKSFPPTVKHIVVIRDTPKMRGNTMDCVQRAIDDGRRAGPACAQPKRIALDEDPALTAARTEPRADVIDMTRFICGPNQCLPVVGGALVYKDVHHITRVYGTTLGPYLQREWNRVTKTW